MKLSDETLAPSGSGAGCRIRIDLFKLRPSLGGRMFFTYILIVMSWGGWAQGVQIEFGETISTCLTREQLWTELNQSLHDSKTSSIWPNDLSTVEGDGLKPEATIAVTYKTSFGDSTYLYLVSEVETFHSFRYSAVPEEHPFEGGAWITIKDQRGVRQLDWRGEYLTPSSAWLERIFFRRYSKNFFKQLVQNIEGVEQELCFSDTP